MSYCNNQPNITHAAARRKQKNHSPWFWLLLMGGSILLHLVLIKLAEGASHSAAVQSASTAVPIDWVELAAAPPSTPTAALPAAPKPAANTPAEAAPKPAVADSAAIDSLPQAVVATPTEPESPAMSAAPPQASPAAEPEPTTPEPIPGEPDVEPTSSPIVQPEPEQAVSTEAGPSQLLVVEERPLPLPSPSPLIATQPIDVPVPDVTETFAIEPEQPTEEITEEIMVPSELTASLTTALPETSDPPLDEAAYPKQEVQTFAANSTSSPCVMSPEAVPFLGKTVAMQVMTDESGQVVDTVTQESSQNPAYDELATCLVKNWDFEPAIAQGQPVATDGLVVRITIEAEG